MLFSKGLPFPTSLISFAFRDFLSIFKVSFDFSETVLSIVMLFWDFCSAFDSDFKDLISKKIGK